MAKYYVVNDYLKNPTTGEKLIHDGTRQSGYEEREDAESAARRINTRLKKRGLVGQARVVKR